MDCFYPRHDATLPAEHHVASLSLKSRHLVQQNSVLDSQPEPQQREAEAEDEGRDEDALSDSGRQEVTRAPPLVTSRSLLEEIFDPQPHKVLFQQEKRPTRMTPKRIPVEDIPNPKCVSYDDCPSLFKAIEKRNWVGLLTFLDEGVWEGFSLLPDYDPPTQAKWMVVSRDNRGILWTRLPFHQAILSGAPLAILQRLLNMYQEAMYLTDYQGNLPLHLALITNAPAEVVVWLLQGDVQAIHVPNKLGEIPIDFALHHATEPAAKARTKILNVFFQFTRTNEVTVPVMSTDLPTCDYFDDCTRLYEKIEAERWDPVATFLHTGTWRAEGDLMSYLEDLMSQAPTEGDPSLEAKTVVENKDDGWRRLPLHLAILNHAPLVVVHRLVQAYPNACAQPDDMGMLPVHLALYNGCPDNVVAYLLYAYPAAINKMALNGQMTCIECAEKGTHAARAKMLQIFATHGKEPHHQGFPMTALKHTTSELAMLSPSS